MTVWPSLQKTQDRQWSGFHLLDWWRVMLPSSFSLDDNFQYCAASMEKTLLYLLSLPEHWFRKAPCSPPSSFGIMAVDTQCLRFHHCHKLARSCLQSRGTQGHPRKSTMCLSEPYFLLWPWLEKYLWTSLHRFKIRLTLMWGPVQTRLPLFSSPARQRKAFKRGQSSVGHGSQKISHLHKQNSSDVFF